MFFLSHLLVWCIASCVTFSHAFLSAPDTVSVYVSVYVSKRVNTHVLTYMRLDLCARRKP